MGERPGGPSLPASPVSIGATAHVFVNDLDCPQVMAGDYHHLSRVRRVRAGEVITVSDGARNWRACVVPDRWTIETALETVGSIHTEPAPSVLITVGFSVTKSDKPETVIQHLTELGVDRVVPVISERSVVRWDDETRDRRAARWRDVAREAAMQSRRTSIPTVDEPIPFLDLVRRAEWSDTWSMADAGGSTPALDRPSILVGPEGGWSAAEREVATDTVSLGAFVLRAETAALTAGAILGALRHHLVRAIREESTFR